jgi:hypothetical protein
MNNFKALFLSVCCISLFNECFSQDLLKTKNAFYFELFGSGGLYSINYERNIHRNIYGRIGFGTWEVTDNFSFNTEPGRITTVPLIVSYLSGYKKHHFEIGSGLLFGSKKDYMGTSPIFNLTGYIGYRYQSFINKGILLRIGLAPSVSLNETNYPDGYFISPGLSVGYHF